MSQLQASLATAASNAKGKLQAATAEWEAARTRYYGDADATENGDQLLETVNSETQMRRTELEQMDREREILLQELGLDEEKLDERLKQLRDASVWNLHNTYSFIY